MLKVLYGTSILCILLGIVSCRKEKYVDQRISDNYYYSVDSTQILYDDQYKLINATAPEYKEVPADVESFRPVGPNFGKDTLHVFYTNILVKNVNRLSFYWDNVNELPKDKYHVYLPSTETDKLLIIKYADPVTYEKVEFVGYKCLKWNRDKNNYFYNHKLTTASRHTLDFQNPLLPYDNKQVFYLKNGEMHSERYFGKISVINKYTLRDNKHFFLAYDCDSISNATIISFKDSTSYCSYDDKLLYVGIDSIVYYQGQRMKADFASFMPVGYDYGKDIAKVYFKVKEIPNSDAYTFKVLNEKYAKDKYQVYHNGRVLSQYRSITFISDKWGRYPPDPDYRKDPTASKK